MDYKSVLQEQVRELQRLQDENLKLDNGVSPIKVQNAVTIVNQILRIYVEVKGSLD